MLGGTNCTLARTHWMNPRPRGAARVMREKEKNRRKNTNSCSPRCNYQSWSRPCAIIFIIFCISWKFHTTLYTRVSANQKSFPRHLNYTYTEVAKCLAEINQPLWEPNENSGLDGSRLRSRIQLNYIFIKSERVVYPLSCIMPVSTQCTYNHLEPSSCSRFKSFWLWRGISVRVWRREEFNSLCTFYWTPDTVKSTSDFYAL